MDRGIGFLNGSIEANLLTCKAQRQVEGLEEYREYGYRELR
jgi:hypothetical protein